MKKRGASSEADLKRGLVEASRILAMEGQGDLVWGHVSARFPGEDTFWIKPTGVGLDEVRVEDLLLCDLDGRVVRGKKPRHIEVFIHSEVMRVRPDVCSVVHTHAIAPYRLRRRRHPAPARHPRGVGVRASRHPALR